MVIRTFFDRNNTIVKNQFINTGQNPVTELFYGGPIDQSFSRFLFQFELDRLEDFIIKGLFPNLNKFTHTLRMTNTGAFDLNVLGKSFKGMDRSSSFNLVLYALNQPWDEGVGYDYYNTPLTMGETNVSTSPSNWFESNVNVSWVNEGAIPSGSTVINTQHFEHGNENLEMDITNYVNAVLSGGTNYGLALAYSNELEDTIRDNRQYVGFFTKHSQTFYEPHVESIYNDIIKDDRYNFFLDKDNKIYLYSNIGGKPTNLDSTPIVTVLDDNENIITSGTAVNASQGVYYFEINIPNNGENNCTLFTDVWSNIIINGNSRPDIEMEFSVKGDGYFNIGSEPSEAKEYLFAVTGLKYGESIKRGDIRKVIATAKIPFTSQQMGYVDSVEYRLYVKEGNNQFTVIDYQPMNIAHNQNYFLLDTMSLLPNTYYLDVKYHYEYEVKNLTEVIKFDIVSQSDLRKSQ